MSSPGTVGRPLAAFAVGYSITHHNGVFGSTEVGSDTRLADWIDIATPFAVVLPIAWLIWRARPSGRALIVACAGAILYVEGHGIHLAANSIGNATDPSTPVVHLWDEVVGHYLWFGGLAVLWGVAFVVFAGHEAVLSTRLLVAGGAVCGITWATNSLEGGTAWFGLALAASAIAVSVRWRGGLAPAFAGAGAVAIAIIGIYGIASGGFPQPSSR